MLVCANHLLTAIPGWGSRWVSWGFLAPGSWLGSAVHVFCYGLCLLPANPGWGLWCLCLGSAFAFTSTFLAWVLGCVCLCARSACIPQVQAGLCGAGVCALVWSLAAPPQSRLECCSLCVCVCFACTPPFLAGVRCACGRLGVLAAPHHSGWGFMVCLFRFRFCFHPANPGSGVSVYVFVCKLRVHPANPGSGVPCLCACVGSGLGCAPPILCGVLGCVCLYAPSACTPPFLAGVCCACSQLRVLGAPCNSWLGSVVCVFGFRCCFQPANPGWAVTVYVLVCPLRLYTAYPGRAVLCWRVCFGLGLGCAPAHLSWLGFGVCVLVCGLYPWLVLRAPWCSANP